MSSNSYSTECNACGGENVQVCEDNRPLGICWECPNCGAMGYTLYEFKNLKEINELRKILEMPKLKKLPIQEAWFIEKRSNNES